MEWWHFIQCNNLLLNPWQELFRLSSASTLSVVLCIRDAISNIILVLPLFFTFGWMPQVNPCKINNYPSVQFFEITSDINVAARLVRNESKTYFKSYCYNYLLPLGSVNNKCSSKFRCYHIMCLDVILKFLDVESWLLLHVSVMAKISSWAVPLIDLYNEKKVEPDSFIFL